MLSKYLATKCQPMLSTRHQLLNTLSAAAVSRPPAAKACRNQGMLQPLVSMVSRCTTYDTLHFHTWPPSYTAKLPAALALRQNSRRECRYKQGCGQVLTPCCLSAARWALCPCCRLLLLLLWVIFVTPHQQLYHVQCCGRDACAWAVDCSHTHPVQLLMVLQDTQSQND
jgi:hypothetical protein